jgi:hypothetical protein
MVCVSFAALDDAPVLEVSGGISGPKPRAGVDIKASMMTTTTKHEDGITGLLTRIRGEFLEMPGLRLTSAQAARLWAVDHRTSEWILDGLTTAGFLRNREGAYLLAAD